MRFLEWAKDGGPDSHVTGFYIVEIKKLFSIVLLRFEEESREAYHSHAFKALTWILKGKFMELSLPLGSKLFAPSLKPKYTPRRKFHKVFSVTGTTWALTFRGPWKDVWYEYIAGKGDLTKLTHGRKVLASGNMNMGCTFYGSTFGVAPPDFLKESKNDTVQE